MSTSKMHEQFLAARRAGTPLIAIKTFDQEATLQALQAKMTNGGTPPPIIQHDLIRGLISRNDQGVAALASAGAAGVVNPIDALVKALDLPFDENTNRPINPVVFFLNAHAYLDQSFSMRPEFIQGLHNIRTPYRDSLRTLVLIGPEFNFSAELQHDILVLDEPLPTEEELGRAVRETCEAASVSIDDSMVDKSVGALRGLVAWEAEQATALSIALHKKLDIDELWQRKKQMISETKGLTVWVGGQTFDGLGGLEEIKKRFRRRIAGKACPRVIVWIDEIEKAMAGAGGGAEFGNSTQSDQLGVILGEMQDKEYSGVLLVGVMGAAKSAFAKGIASEAECITIKLDLGAARGEGLVGQAENDIRNLFKVIEAVGGIGGALIVATSNDIRVIKPELKRRMNLGIWYFDIPTDEEKKVIVEIYKKKYPDVDASGWDKLNTKDWTGAEVEIAFKTAHEDGCSLEVAASTIIPVAISGKDDIARLRQEAEGRYNSTNYPGPYRIPGSQKLTSPSAGRKMAGEN